LLLRSWVSNIRGINTMKASWKIVFVIIIIGVASTILLDSSCLVFDTNTVEDHRKNEVSCALGGAGYFDEGPGNFWRVDDPSCPWVDYAGKVLGDQNHPNYNFSLSAEEVRMKELLLNARDRNILLIGDSQDRTTLDHFCNATHGSIKTMVPPRWTLPNGTLHANITITHDNERLIQTRVCRVGKLTVANFFHFGFIPGSTIWSTFHIVEGEPITIQERIDNVLPKFLEDVFGEDYSVDFVVLHSGLWDLISMSYNDNCDEELSCLKQSNGTWYTAANAVARSLQRNIPDAKILWRNLPSADDSVTRDIVVGDSHIPRPFTFDLIKLVNDLGVSFAKSRSWPVLDLRLPLLQLGPHAFVQDGLHFNQRGWDLYMNRLLNAVMAAGTI
jgi:hypothetical protein